MKKLLYRLYVISKYLSEFGIEGFIFLMKFLGRKPKTISLFSKKFKHPIYLRKNTTDIKLFYDIYIRKEYSTNYQPNPLTIIDLGANIGLASVYFKNLFPNAKIIAVEPEKSNFDMLVMNTQNYGSIHCINKAVWNRATNLIIEDHGHGNWGFMVSESDISNEHSVQSISVDGLLDEFNIDQIDILKIDIEGSEKELFEKNYEKWLPRTKMIIVELHDVMRWGSSKSFFNAITKYEYSMTIKGENLICILNH